jgi:hypothetical protein
MSIDQLIRDLIEEDLFKAKYTTRQRSIFCKNMYAKVSKFIEENNKEQHERIEELEEELAIAQNDLEYYKDAYETLKNRPSFCCDLFYGIRFVIYILYIYYMWNYSVKVDRSIKEINNKSDTPYSIA